MDGAFSAYFNMIFVEQPHDAERRAGDGALLFEGEFSEIEGGKTVHILFGGDGCEYGRGVQSLRQREQRIFAWIP